MNYPRGARCRGVSPAARRLGPRGSAQPRTALLRSTGRPGRRCPPCSQAPPPWPGRPRLPSRCVPIGNTTVPSAWSFVPLEEVGRQLHLGHRCEVQPTLEHGLQLGRHRTRFEHRDVHVTLAGPFEHDLPELGPGSPTWVRLGERLLGPAPRRLVASGSRSSSTRKSMVPSGTRYAARRPGGDRRGDRSERPAEERAARLLRPRARGNCRSGSAQRPARTGCATEGERSEPVRECACPNLLPAGSWAPEVRAPGTEQRAGSARRRERLHVPHVERSSDEAGEIGRGREIGLPPACGKATIFSNTSRAFAVLPVTK